MKTILTIIILSISLHGSFAQSTAEALKFLAPTATNDDFKVENKLDGQGDVIAFWNTGKLGAQPNQAAIDQAKIDLLAVRQAAATSLANERTALAALRVKLNNEENLTPAELRIAVRLLIRRSMIRD